MTLREFIYINASCSAQGILIFTYVPQTHKCNDILLLTYSFASHDRKSTIYTNEYFYEWKCTPHAFPIQNTLHTNLHLLLLLNSHSSFIHFRRKVQYSVDCHSNRVKLLQFSRLFPNHERDEVTNFSINTKFSLHRAFVQYSPLERRRTSTGMETDLTMIPFQVIIADALRNTSSSTSWQGHKGKVKPGYGALEKITVLSWAPLLQHTTASEYLSHNGESS